MERVAQAALFSLWIGGKPVPAGRPRVTRWGVYYPKSYKDWIAQSQPFIDGYVGTATEKPVLLLVEVLTPRPKKTDHVAPMGDVDNFAKGPMDLMTKSKKFWNDDRQVVGLVTTKRWIGPNEEPGFRMSWCEVETE